MQPLGYFEACSLQILKKMGGQILGYNTTPLSLVYGMEAVLPIEVQIPYLWIMKDAGLSEDDWIQTWLDQLNLIDEKRLTAILDRKSVV